MNDEMNDGMLPDFQTVELNRVFSEVAEGIEAMDHANLHATADTILTLGYMTPEKPIAQYNDGDLRSLLMKCADTMYEKEPSMLPVVSGYLDAVMRASLIRRLSHRHPDSSL